MTKIIERKLSYGEIEENKRLLTKHSNKLHRQKKSLKQTKNKRIPKKKQELVDKRLISDLVALDNQLKRMSKET